MRYRVAPVSRLQAYDPILVDRALRLVQVSRPSTARESLLGRLLICDLARLKTPEAFIRTSLRSIHGKAGQAFWSIAHKEGIVAAIVDTKPVAIDIEVNTARSKRLFSTMTNEEWKQLGRKSWKWFYVGWTAKEATLKLLRMTIQELPDISIQQRTKGKIILEGPGRARVRVTSIQTRQLTIAIAQRMT